MIYKSRNTNLNHEFVQKPFFILFYFFFTSSFIGSGVLEVSDIPDIPDVEVIGAWVSSVT